MQPHGHILAITAYGAAVIIVVFFVRDVIGAAYSRYPAVTAFRQSLGG